MTICTLMDPGCTRTVSGSCGVRSCIVQSGRKRLNSREKENSLCDPVCLILCKSMSGAERMQSVLLHFFLKWRIWQRTMVKCEVILTKNRMRLLLFWYILTKYMAGFYGTLYVE